MPDYIYLLENRLSSDQQNALRHLREAARETGMLLFLTGDAVRDLTSGHAVRDLEVAVHGNALKLKKIIEKLGAKTWGEDDASRSLYLCFPGTVRVDVVSTHRREYPKPGKPVFHWASIQEDLRRRDFTVNAMAISLNEGSFGLLMDPLNGAADIEARTLRLVSNYGFLEEPALLIRATRYIARLGWELDPRTKQRYENAKAENVMEYLSDLDRSQELEQIGHEDDGLKVLQALENEGWMKVLFSAWTHAKADEEKLKALNERRVELQVQGVHPDMSAAQMQLLTAKLAPKDLSALKKLMLRPGFVEEWNSLDSLAAGFAKVLMNKANSTPSLSYKLLTTYDPEAVLWLGFTTKDKAIRERYELFLKTWPEARQRIPYALMQEMRITPELATYNNVVHHVFLKLIDGGLNTPEESRAFLEPHSPPAPPPQITIKRTRARRTVEAKVKERAFDEEEEGEEGEEEDLDDIGGGDEEEVDLGMAIAKGDELEGDLGQGGEEEEEEAEEEEEEVGPVRGKPTVTAKRGVKPVEKKPGKAVLAPQKAAPAAKGPVETKAKPETKHPVETKVKGKPEAKPEKAKPTAHAVPAKKAAHPAKPAVKIPVKMAKTTVKHVAKAHSGKPTNNHAPAKKKPIAAHKPAKPHARAKPAKPAAKKAASKVGKRH
jgi:tRNA nucleotidyltransferase/poly(A) polymerase